MMMGFLSKFFKSRDKPKNYLGGLSFLFGGTTAGQTVNEKTSMQLPAAMLAFGRWRRFSRRPPEARLPYGSP